jgi:2-polyprenyl-3-methyl-5-hydroxy-6-metoxy-1,4-benzoquinol methylase
MNAMLRATRGFGILENFLSVQRMKLAKKVLKMFHKNKKILDIGCGSYPLFLINSGFKKKVGVDQAITPLQNEELNLSLKKYNLTEGDSLPFPKNTFDAITMLAFIEHINPDKVEALLSNCYELLEPEGILFLTTPAKWSHIPLKIMAHLHLVSLDEIKEHKRTYYLNELKERLKQAGFKYTDIQGGYFELFLNLWVYAKK